MKKIILSVLILCSFVNIINSMEMDENNNNNNNNNISRNNNNNIKCPVLPDDVWKEIALVLIRKLDNAKTTSELNVTLKNLYNFYLISKRHNKILNDEIKKRTITLEQYFNQRKNEIIVSEIKTILKTKTTNSLDWIKNINSIYINWTLLMYLVANNAKEGVELLIENGANLNAHDKADQTALMLAIRLNNVDIATLLIKNGALLDLQDDHGYTALMLAASLGMEKLVRLLIDFGANANIKHSFNRKTAYDFAIDKGHTKISELLSKKS